MNTTTASNPSHQRPSHSVGARRGHSIFRLADGEVVMVGGFNFNDAGASAKAELDNYRETEL